MTFCPTCGQPLPLDASEAEARFNEFWAVYPRKVGKAGAKRRFLAIVTGKHRDLKADPVEIIAGAGRYAQAMQGRELRYIVLPDRWLNEGRWEDEHAGPGPEPRSANQRAFDELAGEMQRRGR